MTNVLNFICWALTHVKPETVPQKAALPLARDDCGAEPWHYLFGTVRTKTTRLRIEERWDNYYSSHGWTRTAYDNATACMRDADYATDCQGLLDAYLTYVQGEKTDINANINYADWCTCKGEIGSFERPYVIGEALFVYNKNIKRMSHVGWICGFDADGEPLVVEARGLFYGVVITRLESRPWTHRGLMTKKFSYESENAEPMILTRTSPMIQGEHIRKLQSALNALCYTDAEGNALTEDGKCGDKTMQAVRSFANAHADTVQPVETAAPIAVFESADGGYKLAVLHSEGGMSYD